MRVKCVLCDSVDNINSNSPQAKRLRNRRIHIYMCPTCDERIGEKTKQRHATGKFRLHKEKKQENHLI
ncbi:YlaI family protein [Aquibacillus rhizosphaerae]|uniref:YlaI family protein n=1 Tax=Aquibacillus rhizosphaerae TaxID=3051431 RepID=A0ABT7L615_9BACI|nr:YlaI family protein [Aquibacillus sp. LR5S19]MDL4841308.1 YlaI family protein [Aquibacillus sp. LR5S19]